MLFGIYLLREGLDILECALVAILDAGKEGFLRSETSRNQSVGRAARNVDGKAILYADITSSMERAIAETNSRREKQVPIKLIGFSFAKSRPHVAAGLQRNRALKPHGSLPFRQIERLHFKNFTLLSN